MVDGSLGGGGGGDSSAAKGGPVIKGGSDKASRSIEDIRLVFERNKGAIYAIYNRALREEPTLQVKAVLELKIAPSGQVLGVRVAVTGAAMASTSPQTSSLCSRRPASALR